MEEEQSKSKITNTGNLEAGRAEKSVWLMKCPVAVAKSWQSHSHSDPHPVVKVILSIDPLTPDDDSTRRVIDNDRGVHMRPMPGMIGLIASGSKDKKRIAPVKVSEMKRTRRDRGELQVIMFKLFERQPNWALKQLVQETDQPAQFLKEILNELCVYNKRGTNQGTYELKPEYKKSAEETGAE